MTTDQIITAWHQWLSANPAEPADILLQRLHRIAVEVRRPGADANGRRKLFKRRR